MAGKDAAPIPLALFLTIEPKKMSSEQEIIGPLQKYIKQQGEFDEKAFEAPIQAWDLQRKDLRLWTAPSTATGKDAPPGPISEAVLDLFFKYYAFLLSIERRFPISENEVRIKFYWYEIFRQKKYGRFSIHYEKASVLFNIGVMHMILGNNSPLTTQDGIKNACKYFRHASGAFDHLKETLQAQPEGAGTDDLCADALSYLSALSLAQAQEMFYLLGLMHLKMQPGALSKLASSASEYYTTARDIANRTSLSSIAPVTWSNYADMKLNIFNALAQYEAGKEHKAASEFGSELARYKSAVTAALKAQTFVPKAIGMDKSAWIDAVVQRCQNGMSIAQRDNDVIYHEPVTPDHKLSALQKKSMVTPLPLPNEFIVPQKSLNDPFAKLIPFKVRTADSVYSERKASMLREIDAEVTKNNDAIKSLLHALGLPASIEAVETPTGLPPTLSHKMQSVKSAGGIARLNDQIQQLKTNQDNAKSFLDEVVKILDDEEADDAENRKKFSNLWHRTPSHQLAQSFREEIGKFRAQLEHAKKSDQVAQERIKGQESYIQLLVTDPAQVLSQLPSAGPASATSSAASSPAVRSIKELLKQIDQLAFQRETEMKKLREEINQDDVVGDLIGALDAEYEAIYAKRLSRFVPRLKVIRETFPPQNGILHKVQLENQTFMVARSSDQMLLKRQQVLMQLDQAYDLFMGLANHLTEGLLFYKDFQLQLERLKMKCQDYVVARNTEKEDLIPEILRAQQQLQQQQMMNSGYPQQPQPQQQQLPPAYYSAQPASPGVTPTFVPTYSTPSFAQPLSYGTIQAPQPNIRPANQMPQQQTYVTVQPALQQNVVRPANPPGVSQMHPVNSPSFPQTHLPGMNIPMFSPPQVNAPPPYQPGAYQQNSIFPQNPYGTPPPQF